MSIFKQLAIVYAFVAVFIAVVLAVANIVFASHTLWDFYGGNLPSVEERRSAAEVCGISDYRGTYEQNVLFLDCLSSESVDAGLGAFQRFGGTFDDAPSTVAFFETSLQASITGSSTSMTLISATDKAGITLASSTYAFVIDEGTADEELVLADCTGTACTNMTRGLSPTTGTTSVYSLIKSHRRGASIKITDASFLVTHNMVLGRANLPNLLRYKSSTAACSNADDICDKGYIDGVAIAGAPDASVSVEGIVKIARPNQLASSTPSDSSSTIVAAPSSFSYGYQATTTGVVTGADGKINPAQIATNTSYCWNCENKASTTIGGILNVSGTTTVGQLAVDGTNIRINGVNYRMEAGQPSNNASTTALLNNGYGQLSWGSPSDIIQVAEIIASSTAHEIKVDSLPARKKYFIDFYAPGGSTAPDFGIIFNNDRGANYAYQQLTLAGVASASTSAAYFGEEVVASDAGLYLTAEIQNTSGNPKNIRYDITNARSNAATVSAGATISGTWHNSTANISTISIVMTNSGIVTFDTNTRLTIYASKD